MTDVNDAEGAADSTEPDGYEPLEATDLDEVIDGAQPAPAPYIHDASHAGTAVACLEEGAADVTHLHDFGPGTESAAAAAGLDNKDPLYLTLQSLSWYRLMVKRDAEGGAGAELEPLRDTGNAWYWPQPIRTVTEEVKKLWNDVATAATHPIVAARARDLCFAGQVGNGRAHAVAAATAYLQWPTTKLEPLDVAAGLVRAWTLARAVGDGALEQAAYGAMAEFARAEVDGGGNPGTVLPLLEALTTAPKNAAGIASSTVEELVADGRALFPASYLQVRIAAMMRRIARDPGGREEADRAEVQAHLDEAGRASHGAVRMHHLQAAASAAKRLNLKDLLAVAVSGLQSISMDELGLQPIRTSSSLPAYIPESFLRQFDDAHDWREAVHRFLHTDSPSGSYEKNLQAAQRSLERPSLRHLFGGVRIGAHGLPQQNYDADDRLEQELVQFEQMGASLYGLWCADGLDRIAATFGVPDRDELRAFLVETYNADPRVAKTLATALWLFWQDECDASVHLAVPVVEASARGLLLELNEPLYRVEQGNAIGQFPGLGFLLPQLVKCGFDPDWERFLGTLLLPRGENVRNLVAHGFIHNIRRSTAALVLRAAGLMALLAPPVGVNEDEAVVRARLRDPLALAQLYDRYRPFRAFVARARRAIARIAAKLGGNTNPPRL